MKKLAKSLLYPSVAVLMILIPISTVFLVCSMFFMGTKSLVAISSYVLATYTLTVWCMRIPDLIRFFKVFKDENRYVRRYLEDAHLRVKISLYGSLIWNTAYAVFHLGLGLYHSSFWFYSLAGYYIALAAMRFFLLRHAKMHKPAEKMREELVKYRVCGIVLLLMNLTISTMIFFMIYFNRTFIHHEITTITMAAFTFTSLSMSIVNIVRYRKYNSPVYSASKAISLAAACVSMLTLESTMLTTFGTETMTLSGKRIMLACSGGAVSAFIIITAIFMIVQSGKKLKQLNLKEE